MALSLIKIDSAGTAYLYHKVLFIPYRAVVGEEDVYYVIFGGYRDQAARDGGKTPGMSTASRINGIYTDALPGFTDPFWIGVTSFEDAILKRIYEKAKKLVEWEGATDI